MFHIFTNLSSYQKLSEIVNIIFFDSCIEHPEPITLVGVKFGFKLFRRKPHQIIDKLVALIFEFYIIICHYMILIELFDGYVSLASELNTFDCAVAAINFYFTEPIIDRFMFLSVIL